MTAKQLMESDTTRSSGEKETLDGSAEDLRKEIRALKSQLADVSSQRDEAIAHLKQVNEEKITEATGRLLSLATLNFDDRLTISDQNDVYDSLYVAVNMLSEELKFSTVSKNFLDDIFNSIEDALLISDPKGNILLSNQSAVHLFGKKKEKLAGKALLDVISYTNASHIELFTASHIAAVLKDGDGRTFELELDTNKGIIVADFNLRPLNKGKELLVAVKDISERKQRERERVATNLALHKSNKELQQYAHVVSHDLKTPLRSIAVLTDWIKEESEEQLSVESFEHLDTIKQQVTMMNKLLGDVLNYSMLGNKEQPGADIDLNKLVEKVLTLINFPDTTLVQIDQKLPTVHVYEAHMIQLFQNLLSNANKYMDKPKGRINIGCFSPANGVPIFYVKDNGPGIEEKYFDKIFQMFRRLESNQSVDSTGVGLAIVKKVVEEYGGRVWVESTPGKGAEFYFTLDLIT